MPRPGWTRRFSSSVRLDKSASCSLQSISGMSGTNSVFKNVKYSYSLRKETDSMDEMNYLNKF